MDDSDGGAGRGTVGTSQDAAATSPAAPHQPDGAPFHSQLEHIANPALPPTAQQFRPYGQQPFEMEAMAAALPRPHPMQVNVATQYQRNDMMGMMPQPYPMQQVQPYPPGRHYPFDPTAAARMPVHQYVAHPYPPPSPTAQRTPVTTQAPVQHFSQMDPYAYGSVPMHQMDPRYVAQQGFAPYPAGHGDMQHYMRRGSEPAAIPSFPRGPPRKPKQSGHALWVGNLPPSASVTDLKDHFSRDATDDIESLFLISKSNCAFVNYRSEAACIAAMTRFHDSRFNGVRLVCRLRRGANNSLGPTADTTSNPSTPATADSPVASADPIPLSSSEPKSPAIVASHAPEPTTSPSDAPDSANASDRVSERFFIVKSLTVQDLESSVRNGVWATQAHNEAALNRAFDEADTVYLLFSANKSGEYFGYAKMTSRISGEPVHLGNNSGTAQDSDGGLHGAPQSIPTPATATAPKGRIIDDSARGTIFWEAEHSISDEREESPVKDVGESHDGQNWGRQFSIEWMSTTRLPFYRTRGLRNPLNDNREVKIARDGTELDSGVGRRLIAMFHRPAPTTSEQQAAMPPQ